MNTNPQPPTLSFPPPLTGGGPVPPREFTLPPIRTMADDLQAVQRGADPFAVSAGATTGPLPLVLAAPAGAGRVGRNIALPGAGPQRSGGWPWVVVGILIVALLGALGWGVWRFLPRGTGTIADVVPAEALAFFSVQRGSGSLEQAIIPRFTEAFGATPELLGEGWTEAAYVLLPGGSPSEPVAFLLLRGDTVQPQVQGAAQVAVRNFPSGGVAIIDARFVGRLDGLTNATLGRDREFRRLLRKLPRTPALLYLRDGQVSSLLAPFSFLPPQVPDTVLLALAPRGQGDAVVTLTGARGAPQSVQKQMGAWDTLLRSVPASSLTVAGRLDIGTDVDAWRTQQSGNPTLQEFLRALSQEGPSLDALRGLLAGPYLAGSLPTSTAGTRDGFAVLSLKGDTGSQVLNALRPLEDAFRHLDTLLVGSTFSDVAFSETSYHSVGIRFVNFGAPARAFDYAVTDSLLLVATSRESMYLLIDVLKGSEGKALPTDPAFQSLAPSVGAGPWSYLRVDPDVLRELPEAWQGILGGVQGIYVAPTSAQDFVGAATLR